jgi:hypothetical protein
MSRANQQCWRSSTASMIAEQYSNSDWDSQLVLRQMKFEAVGV